MYDLCLLLLGSSPASVWVMCTLGFLQSASHRWGLGVGVWASLEGHGMAEDWASANLSAEGLGIRLGAQSLAEMPSVTGTRGAVRAEPRLLRTLVLSPTVCL